ncbi:MAG: hypothetical protein QHH09_03405 [Microgenomates group bacterium]|nr:hypothetical protein [Microgenomates group bacterium]
MINEKFIYIGLLVFLITSLSYFIETINGKVKPNKVTWFIWSLAPLIAFFSQIKQRVGLESLLTFMMGFVPLLIFLVSFVNKKSYWEIEKRDLICGFLAIIGLILWQITKIGNIAIIFSIISDFLGALPTVIKSYNHPETEASLIFLGSLIYALINLLTIKNWNFENYSFSLYIFLLDLVIFIFIRFKLKKLLKKLI